MHMSDYNPRLLAQFCRQLDAETPETPEQITAHEFQALAMLFGLYTRESKDDSSIKTQFVYLASFAVAKQAKAQNGEGWMLAEPSWTGKCGPELFGLYADTISKALTQPQATNELLERQLSILQGILHWMLGLNLVELLASTLEPQPN